MKKIAIIASLFAAALLAGCATSQPVGSIYTNLKLPVAATGASGSSKVGTAECVSYLALVAVGDSSIQTAAKNAGISVIHHVDWEVENILGVIGKYKVTVYGE